ncbi:DUF3037 domain-containing protein [Bradyrhizobium sp. CB82]|uniref:DUF3037 domain-containing protein n=1 Tax=Bradyrhizobium sp. CB82 TaxID=3039159 RepID=UPI0024B0E747|nr:DUF3037 domain-containing protein [Bradyrhizobium sp. CB82]WFU37556.1 DUF3037 domain-containing protein [Bradyrhizobium sp. CB82]
MKDKQRYSFVILRYVHDVLTEEFINVGVVLYVPEEGRVLARTRSTMGRLRGVFPDLDREAFVATMANVRYGFRRIARRKKTSELFRQESIESVAREAVPHDDSSLQWSSIGGGFSANVQETFDRLYSQFVARYDQRSTHRRSDEEIWRPVVAKLEELNLADILQEKVISGALDDVTFKHAWKNGQWHVYEPVSFDLAEADSIKGKAREWLGHLAAVVADGRSEPFKPHFFVGAPTDDRLKDAYEVAKKILRQAPNEPEVFEEDQLDDFVHRIEDEVRAHGHLPGRNTVQVTVELKKPD